ncbi:hypothetical protein ABT010_02235 [Streptomyces sp. NPDC002668]|uniref:hypothetical protein n=1 Tax=Streptomyces sp. NPDC002668 TaxID=3154422 RepID=UPI00332F7FB9
MIVCTIRRWVRRARGSFGSRSSFSPDDFDGFGVLAAFGVFGALGVFGAMDACDAFTPGQTRIGADWFGPRHRRLPSWSGPVAGHAAGSDLDHGRCRV